MIIWGFLLLVAMLFLNDVPFFGWGVELQSSAQGLKGTYSV